MIARRAGIEIPQFVGVDIIERVPGNSTTDFGAPDKAFAIEELSPSSTQAKRSAVLLEACQSAFADAMALGRRAWTERYRTRRRPWHLTDHLWEIQDRTV
ncbi:MAG: hypothetical protein Q7L55_02560 [Actinomycetota bacterium]|nr:hypothetical protein [Actinomycetota bacterium]